VVTAEFEHCGEVSEQQRRVPLTIAEAHDQWPSKTRGQRPLGSRAMDRQNKPSKNVNQWHPAGCNWAFTFSCGARE
jgi:hypothetical protein